MAEEYLMDSIQLVKKYENYRIQKLWGLALITFPIVNLLTFVLFDVFISVARHLFIIYSIFQGLTILIISYIFFRSYLSIRRLEIKEKEVVSSYYKKLGYAMLAVIFLYVIILLILIAIEEYMGISLNPYNKFPFLLFGYEFRINNSTTYVYWGDNLAIIIGYLLLKDKKQGIKYRELLFGISFLFLYDILVLSIDPFVYFQGIGDYFVFVSGFIAIICGIVSLVRSYKYLKQQKLSK